MPLYGQELRRRVVEAVEEGGTIGAVAARFKVSPWFVKCMKKLRREQGNLLPRTGNAGRKRKFAGREDEIRSLVARQPDLTLAQLRDALGSQAGTTCVHDELKRLGLTLKKSRSGRPSRTVPTSPPSASRGARGNRRSTRGD